MTMQTDVRSSHLNADGVIYAGRTRVRGILVNWDNGTPATNVKFYDSPTTNAGSVVLEIDGNSSASVYMLLPGEGILFENGVYCDTGAARSLTVFYG